MKVAVYTRREAIVAGLFGVAMAGLVWGPVILRSLNASHYIDLGTVHLSDDRSDAPTRLSAPPARVAKVRPGSRVDINHADAEALQALPGIGQTLARRIIAYRRAYGSFADASGLLDVKGIGQKRFDRIEPWVEVR